MKNALYLLAVLGLLFTTACSDCKEETKQIDEIAKVENILEKYLIASENRDFQTIESIWAPGDSIMLFGTDSHEKLMGWQSIRNAFRKQFNTISNTYISISDRYIKINCSNNTAWFAIIMNYNFIHNDVAHSFEGVRFTGVLEKQDEKWLMVQGHLSLPANLNIGR